MRRADGKGLLAAVGLVRLSPLVELADSAELFVLLLTLGFFGSHRPPPAGAAGGICGELGAGAGALPPM
ncbi:hypothetical protein ACFC58_06680 [Kitasatospora purpeofusca]|uniref:hypothetical protein n=1 Tax=Kitasatospora purpeofusca TaxID=67352 RepID=UPI0035E21AB7